MNIVVEEIGTTTDSTVSQLFIDNNPFCFVIEDGYRPVKVPGKTRIPAGRYQVVKRMSGKFFSRYHLKFGHEFSIEIKGVPGFSDILIHIGNTVEDTRGCLLLNAKIGIRNGVYYGEDSTTVYRDFYSKILSAFNAKKEVWIEIIRREVVDENTPLG